MMNFKFYYFTFKYYVHHTLLLPYPQHFALLDGKELEHMAISITIRKSNFYLKSFIKIADLSILSIFVIEHPCIQIMETWKGSTIYFIP